LFDAANISLDESHVSFEVTLQPDLESIVFYGTHSTLEAIENMLLTNITGAFLRFGDGEVSVTSIKLTFQAHTRS
jgi:hypothetical protein